VLNLHVGIAEQESDYWPCRATNVKLGQVLASVTPPASPVPTR
jgi:hypothetical protein